MATIPIAHTLQWAKGSNSLVLLKKRNMTVYCGYLGGPILKIYAVYISVLLYSTFALGKINPVVGYISCAHVYTSMVWYGVYMNTASALPSCRSCLLSRCGPKKEEEHHKRRGKKEEKERFLSGQEGMRRGRRRTNALSFAADHGCVDACSYGQLLLPLLMLPPLLMLQHFQA